MEVVRQHDHGVDMEGKALLRRVHRVAQGGDVLDEEATAPVEQIDREKPRAAGDERTTIVGHGPPHRRAQ